MRCPFSSQKTLFGTKTRHLVLRHINNVYTICIYICFFDMCVLFLSCVGLSHPKYMVFCVFCMYFFQHHFIGKMYQIKKCFMGDYNRNRYLYI